MLAHKFFVGPADQNYFLARFSRVYGMNEEFWWQSMQAIEKLLKAGLILNGVPVKEGYGHNLEKLWKKHKETFKNHAVKTLLKPEKQSNCYWHGGAIDHFILRINQMGQPDCRYGLVSYHYNENDLYVLDQLVFELRRRTIGLDWIVGKDWEDEAIQEFYGKTYGDVIEQHPSYQIRGMKIPKGPFEPVGADVEDILYSWNYAFSRSDEYLRKGAPLTVAPKIGSFGNSYLYLLWEELSNTKITRDVREKVNWLLDFIKIGKGAEEEFRKLL